MRGIFQTREGELISVCATRRVSGCLGWLFRKKKKSRLDV
jgi:hypothetical protein